MEKRNVKSNKADTFRDILLNSAEWEVGGSWSDRWIGPNKIEREGTFSVCDGGHGVYELEFKSIITLGRLLAPTL